MTDARYPERWLIDRRVVLLTDSAHRLFVVAMAWSAGNRTDGELTPPDLHLMPGVNPDRADELVAAQLWRKTASGWHIVDFKPTQTTRKQHEANERTRVLNRERQQRFRNRNGQNVDREQRDDDSDVTRDMTRDISGQARTGQDRQETHNENGHYESDHLSLAAREKWERGYDN